LEEGMLERLRNLFFLDKQERQWYDDGQILSDIILELAAAVKSETSIDDRLSIEIRRAITPAGLSIALSLPITVKAPRMSPKSKRQPYFYKESLFTSRFVENIELTNSDQVLDLAKRAYMIEGRILTILNVAVVRDQRWESEQ